MKKEELLDAHPLSAVDHAWLRMDDPTNLMTINGVLVLDQPVPLERVRAVIERRLLPIPRFRQRIVRPRRLGRPRWAADPHFDLRNHVTTIRLPEPGGEAELRRLVSEAIGDPLHPERPLWRFQLVENYGSGAALFGRMHHCIGDGIALMLCLLSLTDLEPAGANGPAGGNAGESANPFTALMSNTLDRLGLETVQRTTERIMPQGMRLLMTPVEALRATKGWVKGIAATGALGRMVLRSSDPPTVFRGPLGVPKRVAWSASVPVTEVKQVQQSLGGTMNDVLVTALAGGLRRYLEQRGQDPEGLDFRAAVPVNLRPLEQMSELGNRFGLVFLSLPVGIADPAARLVELRRRMQALKRSMESVVVLGTLNLLGRSPLLLQKAVVRFLARKVTAVLTNVPGPTERLYFAGSALRDFFFWVPQSGRVGLGLSILSYAGEVRVGIVSDAGLVPDPERVADAFYEEFRAMLQHAQADR